MKWRRRRESELDRELRAHLDLEAQEQQDAGLSPADARNAARRALGNDALIREDTRAAWGWRSIEIFRQDLRHTLRMLGRAPGFAAVLVLSLALGVGLNSSVFSVLNSLMLRPLAVPEADRLVRIYQHSYGNTSYRNYRDLQAQSKTLAGLAAFSWPMPVAMSAPGSAESEQAWGAAVTANYFDVLGVRAQLGRTFLPHEDQAPGRDSVVVLGDRLWRTRFHADPAILGRAVRINTHQFTVVGVAPAGMPQPDALFTHEFWTPVSMGAEVGVGNRLANRRQTWLRLLGRLKPGGTVAQLQAETRVIAAAVEAAEPRDARALSFTAYGETDSRFRGMPGVRQFGWILQAIAALVLAIACANVVNLLLARSLGRTREIGVRLAIGASRGRIVRQLVTENLVLAGIGGALGLISAKWGARVLLSLAPPLLTPVAPDVAPDWRVLLIGAVITLAIGVSLGLITAFAAARAQVASQLKTAGSLVRPGRKWTAPRDLLVAAQVALSVILLVSAGLFLQSLRNARRLDLGFEPERRLTVTVNPGRVGYTEEKSLALHTEALRRLETLPGVISASSTVVLPLSGGYLGDGFVWPEGDTRASEEGRPMVYFDRIAPRYFETMGAPLLQGREFSERDRKGTAQVAIVNAAFANAFWPGENAVGKRFRAGNSTGPLIEIVGIARDGKHNSLGEPQQKHVYQPFLQAPIPGFTFVLHTAGDPAALAGAARTELRAVDSALPVTDIKTMRQHLGFAYWGPEFGASLLSTLALLGLVLSAIGLYGVLAFVVSRSIPEIGIRIALGASPGAVRRQFVRRGVVIALIGSAVGTPLAFLAARALAHYLYGVSPSHLPTYIAVPLLLLVVAMMACYLPSRRAATIDPLRALRHD